MPRTPTDAQDVSRCFVIMPFNRKDDLARGDQVNFDRVYRDLIKAAVESLNERGLAMECIRSDEVQQAGLIQERMIGFIYDADVAVVDLTTANPNVYYELGVRHALRDRVTVLLRRKGTKNPFNVAGMTTIEYDLQPAALERAKANIAKFIANGLQSGTRDSLVHSMLPGLKVDRGASMTTEGSVETFEIPDAGGRTVGIVGGNLRNVNLFGDLFEHPIDVWVNSENINMQMARPYEGAVSATIRYLGAKKDRTGTIVQDLIADELSAVMGSRQLVNPGEVVSTGAGRLQRSHHVKRIYHVASVYGVVGTGFHSIANAEQCITNALARLDWETSSPPAAGGEADDLALGIELESILFPLLGAGTAKADVLSAARKQVEAAIAYMRSRAKRTKVRRVYFLARDEMSRSCLRVAIAEKLTRPASRGGTGASSTRPRAGTSAATKVGAHGSQVRSGSASKSKAARRSTDLKRRAAGPRR